jgi:hypothetical protein
MPVLVEPELVALVNSASGGLFSSVVYSGSCFCSSAFFS